MDAIDLEPSRPGGPRLTTAGRRDLGRRLSAMRRDRGHLVRTASALGFDPRWLRELRSRAERGHVGVGPGRPRTSEADVERVRALVREQRETLGGDAGERPILAAIRATWPLVPPSIVRRAVAEAKLLARTTAQREIDAAREGCDFLGRDAVWCADATHGGRDASGAEVALDVIRDVGTTATVRVAVGDAPTGASVLAGFLAAAKERGGPPLVAIHDGASVYGEFDAAAEALEVVVLTSRPHTPTDNPHAEHGNREIKAAAGLGKGVEVTPHLAAGRTRLALLLVDGLTPRPSRGGLTADELDATLPRADSCVDRHAFFLTARSAVRTALASHDDPDEAAPAARRAVFETLVAFGLARFRVGRAARSRPVPFPVAINAPDSRRDPE